MIEELSNWGAILITQFLHPLTTIATPAFLFCLTIYFIARAFSIGVQAGIRSLSGALLPLIIMTFVYIFNRDLLASLGRIDAFLGFIGSLIWGIIIMVIIRIFSPLSQEPFPTSEIILSGSFNILVFGYVYIGRTETNILALYYGLVSGFLLYLILFGFPPLKRKTETSPNNRLKD